MMKRFLAVFMSVVVCFSLVFYVPVYYVSAVELDTNYQSQKFTSMSDLLNYLNRPLTAFENDSYKKGLDYLSTFESNYYLVAICDSGSSSNGRRIYTYYVSDSADVTSVYKFLQGCYMVTGNRQFTLFDDGSVCTSIYSSSFCFDVNPHYIDRNYYFFHPETVSIKDDLLKFTVSPDLSENMDLNEIGGNVTVTVENPTDKAYDYMIWVSKNPSDIGIVNSLYNATYVNSSNQWCYKKQSDASIPPDMVDLVKDKISDEFKTLDILDIVSGAGFVGYNVWGGTFEAAKEYMSYEEDHLTYFSKTQSNCPVYLVNPGGAKQHQIPFSAFNITMNDTYYFNISYKLHSSNVVSSVGASAATLLGAAGGEYDAPIFNTSDFTSYQSYTSIPFSVGSGYTSVNQSDDITGYNILTYYSNPNNSVANITNDNSVHINDSYNTNNIPGGSGSGGSGFGGFVGGASGIVINGVLVNGTANFSPGLTLQPGIGGGSSGSGSSISSPELPEADFKKLYDESGDFFKFFKELLDSSGFLPVTLFSSACLVALFMRIWGR